MFRTSASKQKDELKELLKDIEDPIRKMDLLITAKNFVEQATGVRLSAHEKLCAERMKTLNDSINELKREVKSLRQDVSKGKGAVAVLVFIGTLVASIVGFLNFK